ncbi:MAG: hypothetical protein OXE96_10110 [Gemmatimonadetes bacterium]|nr:hypothetical protein [Gemmatimonadota bacterium]
MQFLQTNPNPSNRHFRNRNYWNRAKSELRRAYKRCAYTSQRIRGDDVSVDHFLPKAKYPQLAYEWDNYRLARPKLNRNKADSEGVADPFQVGTGWFVLDCPSCLILKGDNLDANTRDKVSATIRMLKLNSDELVAERCRWLVDLADNLISFDYVKREYPFLASEVDRQGIGGQLKTLFALN